MRRYSVRFVPVLFLSGALSLIVRPTHADLFGSGPNSFTIEFVTITHPGNPPDFSGSPSPAGSVPYVYRIGKYEISELMVYKADAAGGLGIITSSRGPDKPATSVTWFEVAKFANWLNESTGHAPAYNFDAQGDFQLWLPTDAGYDADNLFRNSLAKYFLPSADEWYKAAYYDPLINGYTEYPTGSNAPPSSIASGDTPGTAVFLRGAMAGPADIDQAGGLSRSGTMGQGGNVPEWQETALDLLNDSASERRSIRGAGWNSVSTSLSRRVRSGGFPNLPPGEAGGFRVASRIPEPSGLAIIGLWFPALFWHRCSLSQRSRVSRY